MPATTSIHTLSLHDALPISHSDRQSSSVSVDPSRPKSAWEKRGKVYHSPGEAFGKDDGRRLPTHEPVSADPDSSWHYKGCSHRHRVQNIRPSATVGGESEQSPVIGQLAVEEEPEHKTPLRHSYRKKKHKVINIGKMSAHFRQ